MKAALSDPRFRRGWNLVLVTPTTDAAATVTANYGWRVPAAAAPAVLWWQCQRRGDSPTAFEAPLPPTPVQNCGSKTALQPPLPPWQPPPLTPTYARCIWFASTRTAFGPSGDMSVSCFASLSACSRDLRGGPLIVKTRVRPAWLIPPCGTTICACQIGSPLLRAGLSKTSASCTWPVGSAERLCGILTLSCTP